MYFATTDTNNSINIYYLLLNEALNSDNKEIKHKFIEALDNYYRLKKNEINFYQVNNSFVDLIIYLVSKDYINNNNHNSESDLFALKDYLSKGVNA